MGRLTSNLSAVILVSLAFGCGVVDDERVAIDDKPDPLYAVLLSLRCTITEDMMAFDGGGSFKRDGYETDWAMIEACGGGSGPTPTPVLKVSAPVCGKINLSWAAIPNAATYRIYRDDFTNAYDTTTELTYIDDDHGAGYAQSAPHAYKIRAYSAGGSAVSYMSAEVAWQSAACTMSTPGNGTLAVSGTALNANAIVHANGATYLGGKDGGGRLGVQRSDNESSVWTITANGASEARALAIGSGRIYVAGRHANTSTMQISWVGPAGLGSVDVAPAHNDDDMLLLEVDAATGEVTQVWSRTSCFDNECGTGWKSDSAEAVAVDSEGTIYVGGYAGNDFQVTTEGPPSSLITTNNHLRPIGFLFRIYQGSMDTAVKLGADAETNEVFHPSAESRVHGLAVRDNSDGTCSSPSAFCLAVAGSFKGILAPDLNAGSALSNGLIGVYRGDALIGAVGGQGKLWLKGYGALTGSTDTKALAITFDNREEGDHIWATGHYNNTIDFGSGALTAGWQSIYVVRFPALGTAAPPAAYKRSFQSTAAPASPTSAGLGIAADATTVGLTGILANDTPFGGEAVKAAHSAFVVVFDDVTSETSIARFSRASQLGTGTAAGRGIALSGLAPRIAGGSSTPFTWGHTTTGANPSLPAGGFVARFDP